MLVIDKEHLKQFGADDFNKDLATVVFANSYFSEQCGENSSEVKQLYVFRAVSSDKLIVHKDSDGKLSMGLTVSPYIATPTAPCFDYTLVGGKSAVIDVFKPKNDEEAYNIAIHSIPRTFGAILHDFPYLLTYIFVDDKMLLESTLRPESFVINAFDLKEADLATDLDKVLFKNYIGVEGVGLQ